MANYRQMDGFAPHSRATRFSLWSTLQGRLNGDYPHHLLVLYALPLLAAIWHAIRRFRPRAHLLPLALTLSAAGVLEFLVCVLADAVDTNRHLFLFQIISDSLILVVVAGALYGRRRCTELP